MINYETAVIIPARNEQFAIADTLAALGNQQLLDQEERHAVVVVDNGSTDATSKIVETARDKLGLFDLHLVHEPEVGIGAACDTGFRFAIDELGANVLARLDADTIPSPSWFAALTQRHSKDEQLHLLTGPVGVGIGDEVRCTDRLIVPTAKYVGKVIKMVRYGQPSMLHFAPGHNMSTTSIAYDVVEGFARQGPLTDDVDYNLKIAQTFGPSAFGFEKRMKVHTSLRRVRELGYIGAARYYGKDGKH